MKTLADNPLDKTCYIGRGVTIGVGAGVVY